MSKFIDNIQGVLPPMNLNGRRHTGVTGWVCLKITGNYDRDLSELGGNQEHLFQKLIIGSVDSLVR